MAPPVRAPLSEDDLQGFCYLEHFGPLFAVLRDCATERDQAGNRELFFDQYACLLLLYFFTPTLTSLRGLQQATTLAKVQRRLGIRPTSLGALSEAATVFDAQLLRPLIAALAGRAVPVVSGREAEALRGLTAVDGSLLPALPRMAWALGQDPTHRAAKRHLHFEVLKAAPCEATVTPAACSELEQLAATLQSERLYVLDRGYAGYWLLAAILRAGSSFVCRLQEDAACTVEQERPLSAEARAAGVVRDVRARRLGTDRHKDELKQAVRLVWVATGKTRPDGSAEVLLLCTDRLELEAERVALAYRYRWWVELFFRWLKCILGVRHLLSHSRNGVTLQVYLGLIASLLIGLWTGHKPSKRTFEMVCLYFSGWATAEELHAHIQKLHEKAADTS
jgi:Transposase DDE domain